ncbi:hypothetical protein [Aliikangiella sp. G2MR2-5]|uniref:hypothetical protein n=1 Tax=Aliikangiella sp. G2MR2-5 TaxID=2788943 RepID=UPI0018A8B4D3|nr:hypothetical protein [Aliikangiella sp. G2MR2-5]
MNDPNENSDPEILAKDSIEQRVCEGLDESVSSLNPDVRRALNQARAKAVEKKGASFPFLKLAGGVSFAFAVLMVSQFYTQQPEENLTPFAEVLEEDIEMLDDLEFAYWLAEEEESANL